MPPHLARVYADEGYLSLGSPVTGRLVELDALAGKHLRIGEAGTLDYTLPDDLANLRDVTSEPIPIGTLEGDPGGSLTARVGLAAGACTPPVNPQCWRFPPTTPRRPLTSTIIWTIPDLDDSAALRLVFDEFRTGATRETVLYPIDDEIVVSVYHTEANMLPGGPGGPPVQPGQQATHFAAYYGLFARPVANPQVPVAQPCDGTEGSSDRNGADPGDGKGKVSHRYGAIPYTCMGPAQSTIG